MSPERLSRLVGAAIERFEAVVAVLTRRGRPPRQHDRGQLGSELAITTALLDVATCPSPLSVRHGARHGRVTSGNEEVLATH